MNYLECFKKITPRINITYNCNMFSYCKYCYSKEELKKYKSDMTVENFNKIITWFKDGYDIKDVVFLGGESTFYDDLGKIGDILDKNNGGCFIFTNGCFSEEKLEILVKNDAFHTVVFHYEEEFLSNLKLRNIFLRNLEELSKLKNIVFRFNTGDPKFDFEDLIELSKKHNASIAYSFTSPSPNRKISYVKIEEMEKFVPRLKEFIKSAYENNVELINKRPLPLCIFDNKDIDVIKKIGGVRCICCIGSVCVNPDLSMYAAPTLMPIKASPVKNKEDLIEKVNLLEKEVERLKWKIPSISECASCKYWKKRECQGGCTVYKLI